MLSGKLASTLWFLKRPKLYRQFFHLIKLRLLGRPEADTRAESTRWCESQAIDIPEAITRLTGSKMAIPVSEAFSGVFADANRRVAACPVKMGGPGAIDLLYALARHFKVERAIETGVAYGWSSLAILLALREKKGSRLISTDMPYVQGNNDAHVGLVVPDELRSHWELIRLSDRQALPQAIAKLGRIDFCHYDSDKTYGGRMYAYPLLWNAMRPGGCFISDDLDDNVGFRDFTRQVGVAPTIVRLKSATGVQHVGILIKP